MIRNSLRSRLTRTLVSAGLAGAAGLALVATQAADADAAPLVCTDASCVVSLAVEPGGQSVGLSLTTGVATSATMTVYRGGTLVGQGADYVSRTTHHLTTAATLTPNTAYTWHAWVTDSHGFSVERAGTVSTLHRRVMVQFLTDTVTNDSDTDSNGDFRTIVGVSNLHMIPPLMPVTIGSGETTLMGATLVQRDVGPTTNIATEMYDDDDMFTNYYPSVDGGTWDNGTDDFADWATAKGTLNTATATHGLVPFQISVNSYVGFIVRGYYSVDFVS